MKHVAVLQSESVLALDLKSDSVVVDATYGGGGHAKLICEKLGKKGVYIGIDVDKTAFENNPLPKNLKPTIHLINDNFSNLKDILSSLNIKKVDAILADLGWRTDQFTESGKGFSFEKNEPLMMTFGNPDKYLFSAYEVVNEWEEESIADVLFGYGEERFSRRIARAIVQEREKAPIKTTKELADLITKNVPKNFKTKINPATKSFQALRIVVNDELQVLEKFIKQAVSFLNQNGVLAIISFHSLEDRIVKYSFRELVKIGEFSLVNKKPITASLEELKNNSKARSAKLRIIKKQQSETNIYESRFFQQE